MLSALASVLLLGIVPPETPVSVSRVMPGIETVDIAPPSTIVDRFVAPTLSASGVLLIDAESGEEIFSVLPDTQRPMASLTKIMTALLVLENHELSDVVTVPPVASDIRGSTVGLASGERLTVDSLLKALLLPSANDAAYTLAVFHDRSVSAFVERMNLRAQALGLKNTQFANPAGLDSEQQFSTPRDLAWLTLAALRDHNFRTIVGTRSARIFSTDGREFDLKNTNEMLQYNEEVFGLKTGTTSAAKECLIVLFTEGGQRYLLILLGSNERYVDGLRVLKAVYEASR